MLCAGGSLTYENLNMFDTGRQFMASATTSNFLQPSDDLGFQITYKQPDLLGISDPKRTDFQATVFNTRKISAVFAPGEPPECDADGMTTSSGKVWLVWPFRSPCKSRARHADDASYKLRYLTEAARHGAQLHEDTNRP